MLVGRAKTISSFRNLSCKTGYWQPGQYMTAVTSRFTMLQESVERDQCCISIVHTLSGASAGFKHLPRKALTSPLTDGKNKANFWKGQHPRAVLNNSHNCMSLHPLTSQRKDKSLLTIQISTVWGALPILKKSYQCSHLRIENVLSTCHSTVTTQTMFMMWENIFLLSRGRPGTSYMEMTFLKGDNWRSWEWQFFPCWRDEDNNSVNHPSQHTASIIESYHRMAWVHKDHNDHQVSTPLLCAGSPTTRPGCPYPTAMCRVANH